MEVSDTNCNRTFPRLLVVGSFLPGFDLKRYADGELASEVRNLGGEVITTSRQRWRPLRLIDMLFTAWFRRRDYDLAHITVFSGFAFIYAECLVILLSILRKPCTLNLHGGNLPKFACGRPERVKRLLRRGVRVVCPSSYLLEQMKPYREDMVLIPNALHLRDYAFNPPRSGGKILWLRAFCRIYRPEMAIAVLAKVLEQNPHATLTMVGQDKGDGSLKATEKVAREAGLLDKVTFAGAVPKSDVADIMAQHDVFINTTTIDNTPVSVIEAMASGLCVVSTNVGGLSYLLADGTDSLLVDSGDDEGMSAAVDRVISDREFASHLAKNGRAKAEQFDWSRILPQWEALFADAVGQKPDARNAPPSSKYRGESF